MKRRWLYVNLPLGGHLLLLTSEEVLGMAVKFRRNGCWWRIFSFPTLKFLSGNRNDIAFWTGVGKVREEMNGRRR